MSSCCLTLSIPAVWNLNCFYCHQLNSWGLFVRTMNFRTVKTDNRAEGQRWHALTLPEVMCLAAEYLASTWATRLCKPDRPVTKHAEDDWVQVCVNMCCFPCVNTVVETHSFDMKLCVSVCVRALLTGQRRNTISWPSSSADGHVLLNGGLWTQWSRMYPANSSNNQQHP